MSPLLLLLLLASSTATNRHAFTDQHNDVPIHQIYFISAVSLLVAALYVGLRVKELGGQPTEKTGEKEEECGHDGHICQCGKIEHDPKAEWGQALEGAREFQSVVEKRLANGAPLEELRHYVKGANDILKEARQQLGNCKKAPANHPEREAIPLIQEIIGIGERTLELCRPALNARTLKGTKRAQR